MQLFNPLPRRSRSNCRERFARNALRRDARSERTTDGVKKSVKRIRDAPNYIIDFASNTRASVDRFCIFISVKTDDPVPPLFSSLDHFLFLPLSPFFHVRFGETAAWSINWRLWTRIVERHFNRNFIFCVWLISVWQRISLWFSENNIGKLMILIVSESIYFQLCSC